MATPPLPNNIFGRFEQLENFRVTSGRTTAYNCIAWAAGREDDWWWPHGRGYWPLGKGSTEDVPTFEDAFRTLGYEPCTEGDWEQDVEKVAIYVKDNKVTHMARQVANGLWTSKLGRAEDIEHENTIELEGKQYGNVICYMSRKRSASLEAYPK